jgi:hypothetical protein
MKRDKFSAKSLKETLWETLSELRVNEIDPKKANAIAAQSRELMRVVALELRAAQMLNKKPSEKLLS